MNGVKLESLECVKDLGATIASNLILFFEKRRLRGKIIECFKILKGFTNVDANKMLLIDNTPRTRDKTKM